METNATTPVTEAAPPSSSLERSLDLSVVIADLEKNTDQRLRQKSKKLKMPGFRPGKVPFDIVKRHYGQDAHLDALNELLGKSFDEAVKAQQMRIAGAPKIKPKKTESTTHLEFTAEFEVYPEIELADLETIEIERPTLEVGAAELESTMNMLRRQRARYEPITDRAAARGDRVIVDFSGKKSDGQPLSGNEGRNHSIVLGEGMMPADFENAAIGMKVGESKHLSLTLPDNYYHIKDIAGHTADFEFTVKQVDEVILPEIDAEFARSLGIPDGDVDKMRAEIEANLKREVKNRLKSRVRSQIMDVLLKSNPVKVPETLVEMEIDRMEQHARQEMEQRNGRKLKNFPLRREWFAERARQSVCLSLILSEIVRRNDLYAKPEQIDSAITEFAQSYEHPQGVIDWYRSQPQRMIDIENVVVDDNIVEWVLAGAKVVDKPISFDELMSQRG
ncbi:MAG: trigger factor [Candidatus Accumulibacter sp.]|jgi:trigger factor|nr:trigger factor [Accumulibacter sp.]